MAQHWEHSLLYFKQTDVSLSGSVGPRPNQQKETHLKYTSTLSMHCNLRQFCQQCALKHTVGSGSDHSPLSLIYKSLLIQFLKSFYLFLKQIYSQAVIEAVTFYIMGNFTFLFNQDSPTEIQFFKSKPHRKTYCICFSGPGDLHRHRDNKLHMKRLRIEALTTVTYYKK